MNRSFSYVRICISLREYLWTTPGDRWLGMCQQIASKTPGPEITSLALEHRRFWRDQSGHEEVVTTTRRLISLARNRW